MKRILTTIIALATQFIPACPRPAFAGADINLVFKGPPASADIPALTCPAFAGVRGLRTEAT